MKKRYIILILLVLIAGIVTGAVIYINKPGELWFEYNKVTPSITTVRWRGNKPEGELVIPYRCKKGNKIEYINENDFRNSPKLKSIVIEADLIRIPRSTFQNCFNVEKLTLKKLGITSNSDSFLESIFWGNDRYKSLNAIKEIKIYEGNTIYEKVFYNCRSLEKITLPESITTIEKNAFMYCEKLEYIEIPESVKTIDDFAFSLCFSLKRIKLPEKLVKISRFCFWLCSSLEEVIIPEKVKEIESCAFFECASLKSITLPPSIEILDTWAFRMCSGLTKINIPKSIKFIDKTAFRNCSKLEIYCEFGVDDKRLSNGWNNSLPVYYNYINDQNIYD